MPRSKAGVVAALLARRFELAVRYPGLRVAPRRTDNIDPDRLSRLDLLWSTTLGLFTVDQLRGLYLHARHLVLALDAGEPSRVARALGLEAVSIAAVGGSQRRIDYCLRRARAIANEPTDTYSHAWNECVSAAVAYLQGRWYSALECAWRAEAILREQCPGTSWEIDSVQQIARWSLCYVGQIDTLRRWNQDGVREALERSDRYATMSARSGFPNVVWLAEDDVARARHEADAAIEQWSQRGFHLQHLLDLFAQVQIELYVGDGEAAFRRVSAAWRSLERSGLLRVELNRILARDLRARAGLAAAVGGATNRDRLLALAAADARAIAKCPNWGLGLSQLLLGQINVIARRPGAARLLDLAVSTLERHDMPLHAAAARAMLAVSREDPAGLARAQASIASQARNSGRLLAMLAPALRTAPACKAR
jgi:hypothetical protein